MVTIGNDNANSFWEHHYLGKRLPADVEREIREEFIRAKYQVKSWIASILPFGLLPFHLLWAKKWRFA